MPEFPEDIPYVTCQVGPQTEALSSPADVVVMGGANGGGKSYWLLLEAARHIDVPGYRGVIFRRESTDITDPGGLWDTTMGVYPQIGGWARTNKLDWVFEPDARISFRGLPHFKDAVSWDGKELAFIGFDEGQLFTEMQFWYLFGRMRSTCGVNSCIRMSCNPVHEDDPTGGWLKRLIGWWLDWDTGYPIAERSGVIRWFCRLNNEMFWADSKRELIEQYGDPSLPETHEDQPVQPMSLTFVPSKLKDNPLLMKATPQYRASLLALPEHLKKQKLDGNWNAKLEAGTFFKIGVMAREGMVVDVVPNDLRYVRAWDLAHTEGAGDWTVGAKVGKSKNGTYYITDVVRGQWEAFARDERMLVTSQMDEDDNVQIRIPEDPSSGKSEASRIIRLLHGHRVKAVKPVGKKWSETRAGDFQSQFNAGNVKFVRAPWNSGLLQRLDSFPTKGIPDDECLVARTKIETDRGAIPIEEVEVGDLVRTSKGMQKVLVAAMTNAAAKVFDVVLSNGSVLTGTGNHPVFVLNKGWTRIDSLCDADKLISSCKSKPIQKKWYSTESNSEDIQNRSTRESGRAGDIAEYRYGIGMRKKSLRHVKNADRNSRDHLDRSFAVVTVIRVIPREHTESVFNLTVEKTHDFFANGVLVHNCDAISDAFVELRSNQVTALIANSQPKEPEGEDRPKYNALTEDVIRDRWERIIRDESVCPQWKDSFARFRDDIGPKPSPEHTLRLRNEDDLYSPANCWWGKDGEEPPKPKRNQAFVSG